MRRIARAAVVATGLAVAVTAADLWGLSDASRPRPREITLIYVGAEDCAACRVWQRVDAATFRGSSEYSRITYREVKSSSTLDVLKDEHWPDDLRPYRDRLGRGAGVPLWLLVADGELVQQALGARQWKEAMLPKLKSLVR
jgi:hypothetical protein